MSNQAYEKLHKLVKFLLKNNILNKADLVLIFDISKKEFELEFEDELN